jgi:hypothetical protein
MFGKMVDKLYIFFYHVKIVRKGCGDDGTAPHGVQVVGERCGPFRDKMEF